MNPKLKAELILKDSHPIDVGGGNYKIKLSIEDAPADTLNVVYELDPTYYDAVREKRDAKDGFAEQTTTYGDYPVMVQITSRSGVKRIRQLLSVALAESHAADANLDVQNALREIKEN